MILHCLVVPLSLLLPSPLLRTPGWPAMRGRGSDTRMLRNFDRCELIIFTRDAALHASTGAVREGVARLIGEAKEESTLIALLEPSDRPIDADDPLLALFGGAPCWRLSGSEPEVAEVTALRRALCVDSPDGFGGSDGFGRAPGSAFGREPDSPRCVVLVTSLQETVAAIGAGMRTVGLPRLEGDWVDEALDGVADTCLDALGEEEAVLAPRRLHLLCTSSAPPLHPLCTPSAPPLHLLCTSSAPSAPSAHRCTPLHPAAPPLQVLALRLDDLSTPGTHRLRTLARSLNLARPHPRAPTPPPPPP